MKYSSLDYELSRRCANSSICISIPHRYEHHERRFILCRNIAFEIFMIFLSILHIKSNSLFAFNTFPSVNFFLFYIFNYGHRSPCFSCNDSSDRLISSLVVLSFVQCSCSVWERNEWFVSISDCPTPSTRRR